MTHPEPSTAARPRRADAARSVRSLLAAARALFDEHGPDIPLDEVARRAGVGNATLYRHFPTRQDLIVAVYAGEVTTLRERGAALLESEPPDEALFSWLDGFLVHVATKRALALAGTENDTERRTELFDEWHRSMRSTAQKLLARAQRAGALDAGLTVDDLLALTGAAALAATGVEHARRLLLIMRHGFAGTSARSGEQR
ncbi:TetR/AcrR family transcriptional regulator [Streptosporangium sp. DT93]|uniref:TetR/AcrR family transcriptional regulator n=1 Tax=Streptosporangium sp. DT93 TaxID=3393428 RepID=UPI003CF38F0B